MATIDFQKLQEEHSRLYPECESLCRETLHQITHLIEKTDVKLAVPIQYRAKKWASIQDKLEQGRFSIKKSLKELQDLVGLRIILLFQRDADVIVKLIEESFKKNKKYNTGERLEDNQFGYSSIHIVAAIPEEWLNIPTFSGYKEFKIEFQVRTLSQHSWAEASNIFQYKQEDSVPKPLKRSIGRISALLETVDLEYERLLSDREEYKNQIKTQKQTNDNLNVDVLAEVLNTMLPQKNKRDNEDYSDLLDDLKHFGVNTKKDISDLINSYLKPVLKEDIERAKEIISNLSEGDDSPAKQRASEGHFYSHEGLIRVMLYSAYGDDIVSSYLLRKRKD